MNDFDLERERMARRRKVSEAMLAQSMQPMPGTEYASGIAVRRSPLEGIAKVAQAYMAQKGVRDLDTEEKSLAERQRSEIASAMGDYTKAITPRPGSTEQIMDEQANDGMGATSTVTAPSYAPSPADRQTAAMGLMGRIGDPRDAAKAVVADAMKPREIKAYKPGDVLYQDGAKVGEIPKTPEGYTLSPGGTRFGGDNKPVANLPTEPAGFARELMDAGMTKGSPEWNAAMKARIGKQTTHAPAASMNVAVSTEKQFLGQVGEKLGGAVATATEHAKAAVSTLNTVGQIREALDSGKVVAGPGTTPQMVLMQIGEKFAPGASPDERLTKTRSAIQGLAQLELDAAQQMKGQGQITEAEREIIRRASAGEIDKLTVPELRVLTNTLDKTARFKIRANAANVQRLRANPSAASMVEFMNVDEPPAYKPGGAYAGPDRRGLPSVDAIDAELAKRKGR